MNTREQEKTSMWNKFTEKFFNSHGFSTRRKFYNSVWSIIFGFLTMIIVLSFFNVNPFSVVLSFFHYSFNDEKLIPTIVSFILASLAISICFKAGIFNIGVPGQMTASGIITYSMIKIQGQANFSSLILSIFLSVLSGILISLIIAILKAYLNINEVVTSIMLNWIIFFIVLYLIKANKTFFPLSDTGDAVEGLSNLIPSFFTPKIWYKSIWMWILILIGIISSLSIWMVMKFTKFGYKIKMVGLSPTAAEYSGTNKKHLILFSLSISGFLSGLSGFVYFFCVKKCSMDAIADAGPIALGFNAIAVSLIVFDNPIAIIFSSILFSIVTIGSEHPDARLDFNNAFPKEMANVISGIFVYCAALAFTFSKFVPYTWIRNFFILIQYKEYRSQFLSKFKEYSIYHFSWFKEKKEIFALWNKHHSKWCEINNLIKNKRREKEKELSSSKKFVFSKLDNNFQIEYLNYLSKLKKEKDHLLAENSYFEKNLIKSKRQERFHSWKQNFVTLKIQIIEKHLNIEHEKIHYSTKETEKKEKEIQKKKKRRKNV